MSIVTNFNYNGLVGEYIPLKYLQSDGRQWMETDVNIQDVYGAYMEYELTGPSSGYGSVMGSTYDNFTIGQINGSSTNSFFRHRTALLNSGTTTTQKPNIVDIKNGHYKVNQFDYTISTTLPLGTDTKNIWLFGVAGGNLAKARIYCLKLYGKNWETLLDLKPVLDANQKPCMYDV